MNAAFINALASHGAGLITHIGLLNSGTEISGGSYARISLASVGGWTGAAAVKSPGGNMVFNIPAGATVNEWRGYTAPTGGTDYGGASLTPASFTNAGTYTLTAASTNFTLANV